MSFRATIIDLYETSQALVNAYKRATGLNDPATAKAEAIAWRDKAAAAIKRADAALAVLPEDGDPALAVRVARGSSQVLAAEAQAIADYCDAVQAKAGEVTAPEA